MEKLKRIFCFKNNKERPKFLEVFFRLIVFIVFILSIRWFVVEPFVVPSGSMFPNLYVSDYILVSKMGTGLKIPFTNKWLWGPKLPQRGEIVVFKSKNDGPYFVKRLIGLPGDKVVVLGHRVIKINNQDVGFEEIQNEDWDEFKQRFDSDGQSGLKLYAEQIKTKTYYTMYKPKVDEKNRVYEFMVPQGQLFFMGDHRSASSDSREWGTLPENHIVGPVWKIFLSCDRKSLQYDFCDLRTIRWDRILKKP